MSSVTFNIDSHSDRERIRQLLDAYDHANKPTRRKGPRHGPTARKLSDDAVRDIRSNLGVVSQRELAARHGVSEQLVGYVARGVTYKDVV